MAKIKCNINEDSTLVKFGSLQIGDVFICNGKPCVAMYEMRDGKLPVNAYILDEGLAAHFDFDDLVTYVKKAELNLTI